MKNGRRYVQRSLAVWGFAFIGLCASGAAFGESVVKDAARDPSAVDESAYTEEYRAQLHSGQVTEVKDKAARTHSSDSLERKMDRMDRFDHVLDRRN